MTQKGKREMTPAQCRAARGLLDWTQQKLAIAAGVAVSTVASFERSLRVVTAKTNRAMAPETIQAMQRTLEAAGVDFSPENGSGAGVRFRKGKLN